MPKLSFLISILIVLACSFHYGMAWRAFGRQQTESSYKFEVPEIPRITRDIPKNITLGNFSVWGLSSPALPASETSITKESIPDMGLGKAARFVYKTIGGIPSLCKVGSKDYRWEFYGTLQKEAGFFAVFYNPALKKVKLVRKGETLDNGLIAVQLSTSQIKVKSGSKGEFLLKIFNAAGMPDA